MSEILIGRLRLASGLTLFAFVLCHFLNHAVGLISLDAMQAANPIFLGAWFNPAGNALLIAAFTVHFAIGLRAIYLKRSLAMARWEWAQIAAGLAIPPLLFAHVLATRGGYNVGALQPTYPMTIAALWVGDPFEGVKQGVALLVAADVVQIALGRTVAECEIAWIAGARGERVADQRHRFAAAQSVPQRVVRLRGLGLKRRGEHRQGGDGEKAQTRHFNCLPHTI